MVSLFHLPDDPQEKTNLATTYPDLVKELLAEAEEVVENAPPPARGDMVHAQAPTSKQLGMLATLRSLGSVYEEVTPFGIYLEDSQDLTRLEYVRLADQARADTLVIFANFLIVFLFFPLVIIVFVAKFMV